MPPILRQTIAPILAGFLVSFLIMMVFEFTNSFLFPFPATLDTNDLNAVRAFTKTLPPTAFVLVFAGWIHGSLAAGYLTTRLSKETTFRRAAFVGVLLTLLGLGNNLMLQTPLWSTIVGLPIFLIFTYLGSMVAMKQRPRINI